MKKQVKKQVNKSEIYLYEGNGTMYYIRKDTPCPNWLGREKTTCTINGTELCEPRYCD